jgi:hypothetical protein
MLILCVKKQLMRIIHRLKSLSVILHSCGKLNSCLADIFYTAKQPFYCKMRYQQLQAIRYRLSATGLQVFATSQHRHLTTSPPHNIATSQHRHLTTSPPHNIATSQHRHLTTSPPRHLATSQHRNIATSQHRHLTTSQHRHLTTSPHHNITTSQHRNITTSQHRNITTSQHHHEQYIYLFASRC